MQEPKAVKVQIVRSASGGQAVIISVVRPDGFAVVSGGELDNEHTIETLVFKAVESANAFDPREAARVHEIATQAAKSQVGK